MKIFKYATIVIALATGLTGCDKNEHTLCDEKDIGGAVAIMNDYLAGQPKDWDFNEKIDDLGEWLKKYPCCYGGINQYCESCVIVSVPDGVNNPFGHEFHINFKNKKYVLYFSAKKPFGIVDCVGYDERYLPADPNMSDQAKAILGKWRMIATDFCDGSGRIDYFPNALDYLTLEFFPNGSYRFHYYMNMNYPNNSFITGIGTYCIDQEHLRQESVSRWDYQIFPSEYDCYKYSFYDEDKLKWERCIPYPQGGWYDECNLNIFIFQQIN